jgi:hypothetical protein
MFMAKQYRTKAAESAESLKRTVVPGEIREFQQSIQRFNALAENEDWLADNFNEIVHSGGGSAELDAAGMPVADATAKKIEERILRCLGAAVIMQWNTIPPKLQRELFDTAGSMGDVLKSAALRAQIARFLHRQKGNDRVGADRSHKPNVVKETRLPKSTVK